MFLYSKQYGSARVCVCIIYRNIRNTVCVSERVVVTAEKNLDCGAEGRMMDEQVAASKPPWLE